MKRFLSSGLISLTLLGGVVFAQDDYATAYSSPEASADLPPNLTIAKGLPPVREAGLEAVKRIWESFRTSSSSKKLAGVPATPKRASTPVPQRLPSPRE